MSELPSLKGNRTVGYICAYLLSQGYTVLYPMVDEIAYDLLIDLNGKFIRVQCKTGRIVGDVVRFSSCSAGSSRSKLHVRHTYYGRADYFAVWCIGLDQPYFVPVEQAADYETSIRFSKTKNNQKYKTRWAEDYTHTILGS